MKYLIITLILISLGCKSNTPEITSKKVEIKTIVNEKVKPDNETSARSTPSQHTETDGNYQKITKTDEQWKSQLSDQEYYVLREEGTERSFTSELLKEKRAGMFVCKACGFDLFESETKFKSGTGWPSFYKPVKSTHVNENTDHILGYARTEIECARCGGHLGHVFSDGPQPTGLRYCINGVSLDFEPSK